MWILIPWRILFSFWGKSKVGSLLNTKEATQCQQSQELLLQLVLWQQYIIVCAPWGCFPGGLFTHLPLNSTKLSGTYVWRTLVKIACLHVFGFRSVKGLHLNFAFLPNIGLRGLMGLLLGAYVPWLVGLTREDSRRLFPYFERHVYDLLRETGYLHIQGTKPDTAGMWT